MTHVSNHSPKKNKFKKIFSVSMIAITVTCSTYYCNGYVTKKPGELIEQHDNSVQSNKTITNLSSQFIQVQKHISNIPLTWRPEENPYEEEIKEYIANKRKNTLYYINDNGYKYYLDKDYQDHLYNMCKKYKVKKYYTLLLAQIYHESSFTENIISNSNDYGLMQINICNHGWLGDELNNHDFLDPYNSIEAGVYMMSMFLHKYNDVEKALVCYNRGESAVKNGTYSTTYSRGVLEDMKLLVELEEE